MVVSKTALSFSNSVNEICTPLDSNLGINYFTFVRQYSDRSRICLTNHGLWHEHFCKSKLYLEDTFDLPFYSYVSGYFFWDLLKSTPVYKNALNDFHIQHGLTLVDRNTNFCDFYHFGTYQNDPLPLTKYLNNLDSLRMFTFFFKEKSLNLVKKSHIILFDEYKNSNANKKLFPVEMIASNENFLKEINIKKYYFNNEFDNIYLTKREIECVKWLVNGKSSYEIGLILGISTRTAQAHIDNIKQKFNCFKLSSLVFKLANSYLSNVIFPENE